jgi:hypothetical protein
MCDVYDKLLATEDSADPIIATNNYDNNNATINEYVQNSIVPIHSPSPIEMLYNKRPIVFEQIIHFIKEAILLEQNENTHNYINLHEDEDKTQIINLPSTNQPNPTVNLPITNQPVCPNSQSTNYQSTCVLPSRV